MRYQIAEKFKSIQGEGVYAGTPMAFIRFVGCSVGKKVCHACDTDFDTTYPWRGGGDFSESELSDWTLPYKHVCLTGGEPLDQELSPFYARMPARTMIHIETSGTRKIPILCDDVDRLWVCVSPKPGFIDGVVLGADEVKVIVPGLGSGPGWPTIQDALRWAEMGKIVFLQPRNGKFDVDHVNLKYVQDLLVDYPQFRLSVQMHKVLKVQ